MGPINDYGQTLETADRSQLLGYIASLEERGVQPVYLATWRDPFGDPVRYAQELFRAWALSPHHALFVLVRGEDGRWRVALWAGAAVPLPSDLKELLAQAQQEANRARPGYAALRFFAAWLSTLERERLGGPARPFPWKYVVLGGALLGLGFFLARRICPRCGWFLERRESLGGILLVCPRCRYTRVGRGRRPGGRRGPYP